MFDYSEAFNLIDYNVLVNKICLSDLPHSIVNWIIEFFYLGATKEFNYPVLAVGNGGGGGGCASWGPPRN